jgi:5'-deoxynucleotidase YfbR-like HD superfamily hydrolase
MTAATTLTMANGKGIDLLAPKVDDIHWPSIAEHLAKEKRYNGATPDCEYSVAQHSFIGADAILKAGGTDAEAAYFLLHDCHEALLKDDTTPKKKALAELAAAEFGILAEEILSTFDMLVDRIDGVIHQAAGLAWPMSADEKRMVKSMDLTMFVTEWRDVMHDIVHPNWAPYSGIKPLAATIEPLRWPQARAGWLVRANRLLPALRNPKIVHAEKGDA